MAYRDLPIAKSDPKTGQSYLVSIVHAIRASQVVMVIAPTGTGKSLMVPYAIAQTGGRCFVSVPTRIAATSLYSTQLSIQKAELKTDVSVGAATEVASQTVVNSTVGFAAEDEVHYDAQTSIVYTTGGHLKGKMLRYFQNGKAVNMDFTDILMLDEMHSGNLDNSVILALWSEAYNQGVMVPRLLLASATPTEVDLKTRPVTITVPTENYPVSDFYAERNWTLKDQNQLYIATSNLILGVHTNNPVTSGHILVFTPGKAAVNTIVDRLQGLNNAIIFPMTGSMPLEQLKKVHDNYGPEMRKIIVATNVVETSITINDVGFVFDTMLEKILEETNSGGQRLTVVYESKDSAQQRRGRTGRTRAGQCYRMCTKEFYDKLELHRPPEISRVPIHDIILELSIVGLTPRLLFTSDLLTSRIENATNLLVRIGAIVRDPARGVNEVTQLGRFTPRLKLGVLNAAFYWHWMLNEDPIKRFPGIVVACIIDCYGPSYFYRPDVKRMGKSEKGGSKEEESEEFYDADIYFERFKGNDDLETMLNVWVAISTEIPSLRPSHTQITKWCVDNSMNSKKIRELLRTVERCVLRLNRTKSYTEKPSSNNQYAIKVGPIKRESVPKITEVTSLYLAIVYSDRLLILGKDGKYYRKDEKYQSRSNAFVIDKSGVNYIKDLQSHAILAVIFSEYPGLKVVNFGVIYHGTIQPKVTELKESPSRAVRQQQIQQLTSTQQTTPTSTRPIVLLDLPSRITIQLSVNAPQIRASNKDTLPKLDELWGGHMLRLLPNPTGPDPSKLPIYLEATPSVVPIAWDQPARDDLPRLNFPTAPYPNDLDRQYNRYLHVGRMIATLTRRRSPDKAAAMVTMLADWLMIAANDRKPIDENDYDEIFNYRKVALGYGPTQNLINNLKTQLNINEANVLIEFVMAHAREFIITVPQYSCKVNLEMPSSPTSSSPITPSTPSTPTPNTPNPNYTLTAGHEEVIFDPVIVNISNITFQPIAIKVTPMTVSINPLRLSRLHFEHATVEDLAKLYLLYNCIYLNGMPKAINPDIYIKLVDRYGVTTEVYASPLDSLATVYQKGAYNSLFEYDKNFGSKGSAFNSELQDYRNQSVYLHGSAVLIDQISNQVVSTVFKARNEGFWVRFFILIPAVNTVGTQNLMKQENGYLFAMLIRAGQYILLDPSNFNLEPTAQDYYLIVSSSHAWDDYNELGAQISVL